MLSAWIAKWLELRVDDERYKDYYFLVMALVVLVVTNLFFLSYNIFVIPDQMMRDTLAVATSSCLLSLLLMKGCRAPKVAAFIMQLNITLSSFALVLAAGHSEFSLAFMFITPVVSMFILGYKLGAWFSSITFVVIASYTLSSMDAWEPAYFDTISFIHFTAVFAFLFFVGFFYDHSRRQVLASLRESNQKLQELATKDQLTGLANRRCLDDFLHNVQQTRWIAMIDVDDFKQINDLLGHDVGDYVLCHLARCLEQAAEPEDLVGRWGGEEFLFSIDADSEQAAQEKVKRLLAGIACFDFAIERPVTVSIGLALHQPGQHRSALLHADEALYLAKASGKNQFCLATEKLDYAV
ncbi:GGDEF domain-containing protein [Vibrio navarrensis]|uniref:diguanylate cyclase n=1 Tax=Vibrio navarrensis TaxID=29495 RepID=A0AAI9CUL8_9VIBR|nr:GGDEF domain-containing protein [Vibrio navarrensis]EJL6395225.1 GGDEF domain-containing protein [Vibrio navarrensis]EJL6398279.1 GGDEF domain-containing protein [Vibrio navarrensis]EJL6565098.1 GGDEF domain-containing protein [Vibrio navarrensis]EKA5636628.1 GGDEF domain-containing protein [Vibrio navarrensis]ELN6932670.1 GGDEF domain-containing protein [Vibrio navarrensis]